MSNPTTTYYEHQKEHYLAGKNYSKTNQTINSENPSNYIPIWIQNSQGFPNSSLLKINNNDIKINKKNYYSYRSVKNSRCNDARGRKGSL